MGYYYIELSAHSKELCTITTQWGKFEYQLLPMGLCNSPDVLQEQLSELLNGLDTVRVHLNHIFHVTKGSWQEHLDVLDQVFTAAEVADIAEKTWFTRYPLPQNITLDRGKEFMAEFAKMVREDYGLKIKPITTRNPQANAIIERVHQTI
jgi:hypothetical protein